MVSAESAVAPLLDRTRRRRTGGRDVATRNQVGFERLAALFELSEQRTAIALVSAHGLAGLPGLAGELARRWNLAPIDLTRDEDPYVDLEVLPHGRVLLGLSLLSPKRMQDCLIRLNRGRDRIHALGLHIVLVIHDMDVRAAYEHAPDFASRINELLEFDSEAFGPPRTGLLSPLGPVRHPDPRGPIASDLSEELRGIGHRVRLSEHTHWRAAAAAGWSLAEHTHTRVAWIECGRWDFERTLAWLTELGSMRAWIMFGADNDFLATVAAPSSILSSAVMLENDDSRVDLLPEVHIRPLGPVLRILVLVERMDDPVLTVLGELRPHVDMHVLCAPQCADLITTLDAHSFQVVHVAIAAEPARIGEQELAWALGSHAVDLCILDTGGLPHLTVALIDAGIVSVLEIRNILDHGSQLQLFRHFYAQIIQGQTVAQALRAATQSLALASPEGLRLYESLDESPALVRPLGDQTS